MNAFSQRALPEQDHALQTALLDAADELSGVGVQIWRSRRQPHRLHASPSQHGQEFVSEERIPIVNQVALTTKKPVECVGQISADLAHPQSVWPRCDARDLYFSRGQLDEEE